MRNAPPVVTAAQEMEKTTIYSTKLAVRFSPAMVIMEKGKTKLSIKRSEFTDIYAGLRRLEDLEARELARDAFLEALSGRKAVEGAFPVDGESLDEDAMDEAIDEAFEAANAELDKEDQDAGLDGK